MLKRISYSAFLTFSANVLYLRHNPSLQYSDSYRKYAGLYSQFILILSNILTELLNHQILFMFFFKYIYSCFPFERSQGVKEILHCTARHKKQDMTWLFLCTYRAYRLIIVYYYTNICTNKSAVYSSPVHHTHSHTQSGITCIRPHLPTLYHKNTLLYYILSF